MTNDPNQIWSSSQSSGPRAPSNQPERNTSDMPIDSVAALQFISSVFEQMIVEFRSAGGHGRLIRDLTDLRRDIADRKWHDLDYLENKRLPNDVSVVAFLRGLDRFMNDDDHDKLMRAFQDVILPEAIELAEARRVEMPTVISPSVALMRAQIEALETQPASSPPPEPTTSAESDSNGIILYWSSLNRRTKILMIIAAIMVVIAGFLLVSFLMNSDEEPAAEAIGAFADGGEVITLPTLFPTGTPIILATAPNPNTSAGFCLQVTRMPRDYCYGPNPPQDGSCSNPVQYWDNLVDPYSSQEFVGYAILMDDFWKNQGTSKPGVIYLPDQPFFGSWHMPLNDELIRVNAYLGTDSITGADKWGTDYLIQNSTNGPNMLKQYSVPNPRTGQLEVVTADFAISPRTRDDLGLSGNGPFLIRAARQCALGSGY